MSPWPEGLQLPLVGALTLTALWNQRAALRTSKFCTFAARAGCSARCWTACTTRGAHQLALLRYGCSGLQLQRSACNNPCVHHNAAMLALAEHRNDVGTVPIHDQQSLRASSGSCEAAWRCLWQSPAEPEPRWGLATHAAAGHLTRPAANSGERRRASEAAAHGRLVPCRKRRRRPAQHSVLITARASPAAVCRSGTHQQQLQLSAAEQGARAAAAQSCWRSTEVGKRLMGQFKETWCLRSSQRCFLEHSRATAIICALHDQHMACHRRSFSLSFLVYAGLERQWLMND